MSEYILRFLIGGLVVSAFAVIGDILRPKSFAGLFGAAPSVALATLAIAAWKESAAYLAIEGRSMAIGALALCLYSVAVCYLMQRRQQAALRATGLAFVVWVSVALGLKWLMLGGGA
jgi:hypothetical protein